MVTLRRIGVVSAGRVAFFFGFATTIVNIAFALFMIVVVQGVPISVFPPDIWFQLALNILLSSAIMAVGAGLFAFLYNLNSGIGGLKLEFEMQGGEKRKNDFKQQVDILDDDDDDDVDIEIE